MSNSTQRDFTRFKPANTNEQISHKHATSVSGTTTLPSDPNSSPTYKTTLKKKENSLTAPISHTRPYQAETPRLPNDTRRRYLLRKGPLPTPDPLLRRWRERVEEISSNFARSMRSAVYSALCKEDTVKDKRDSHASSAGTGSSWDQVESSGLKNESYEQFVKQQDAAEYDQVDERETESDDEGDDDDEEEGLGGERWDKTL